MKLLLIFLFILLASCTRPPLSTTIFDKHVDLTDISSYLLNDHTTQQDASTQLASLTRLLHVAQELFDQSTSFAVSIHDLYDMKELFLLTKMIERSYQKVIVALPPNIIIRSLYRKSVDLEQQTSTRVKRRLQMEIDQIFWQINSVFIHSDIEDIISELENPILAVNMPVLHGFIDDLPCFATERGKLNDIYKELSRFCYEVIRDSSQTIMNGSNMLDANVIFELQQQLLSRLRNLAAKSNADSRGKRSLEQVEMTDNNDMGPLKKVASEESYE